MLLAKLTGVVARDVGGVDAVEGGCEKREESDEIAIVEAALEDEATEREDERVRDRAGRSVLSW